MKPSVAYLGHGINKQGIYPTEEKTKAITEAPAPTNISELRSYLGLLNYYHKFPPNLRTTLSPLYKFPNRMKNGTGINLK